MWPFGISSAIGTASSIDAKLWALPNGPKFFCSLNLPVVEIEVDAKVLVKWVSGRMCNNYAHSTLISYCRQLMRQTPSVKIKHCYQEVNQCVDRLVKNGANQSRNFMVFANPFMDIILLMYYDSMDLCFERLCLNSFNLI